MGLFYVYVVASRHRTLYVGVTNDLRRRIEEHRGGIAEGFPKRGGIERLVYFEIAADPFVAIDREKRIRGWRRSKKLALIERQNPEWRDLSDEWSG